MEVIQAITTKNNQYTKPTIFTPTGIMLHSVGCAQPRGEVFARLFNVANLGKSVHGFIDANTGVLYQTLPYNYKAGHCGGILNNTHLAFEMCEPDAIKYNEKGNAFVATNKEKALKQVRTALDTAVELFANLCIEFNIDPDKENSIISHKEAALKKLASAHGDPEHLFLGLNMDYNMDKFRAEVKAKIKELNQEIPERFQTINEIEQFASWATETVEKLVSRGALKGTNEGLDLSLDMLRVFVVHDRMGLYDR